MNSAEQKALRELQQYASKLGSKNELSGWSVRTGRQGVYYQHEGRSLSFQTLGAAKVAVQALSQDGHSSLNTAIVPQEDDDGNDEDEEGDELLNLCSSLDGQLRKHMTTLQSYQRQPYESTETSWAVQSKMTYVHMCTLTRQG